MASNHLLAAAIFSPTSAMTRIVFPFREPERVCEKEIYRERERDSDKERKRETERFFGDSERVCEAGCVSVVWRTRGGGKREREGWRGRERERKRQ